MQTDGMHRHFAKQSRSPFPFLSQLFLFPSALCLVACHVYLFPPTAQEETCAVPFFRFQGVRCVPSIAAPIYPRCFDKALKQKTVLLLSGANLPSAAGWSMTSFANGAFRPYREAAPQ